MMVSAFHWNGVGFPLKWHRLYGGKAMPFHRKADAILLCKVLPCKSELCMGRYFTSQMSLVSSSSVKLWYFFLSLTSSIWSFTAWS